MVEAVDYCPPRTVKAFIKDYIPGELFYNWIVGPLGSGKTTGNFFKLVYMASKQAKGPDGVRRSRCVVVRNTSTQLKDTTIRSWFEWFKDGQAGKWYATDKNFILKFADVECEVMFRPLDTPEDVARVLSLEVTFAIIDEFIEVPKEIVDALSGRCGRYPSKKTGGATNWGMWGSSNPGTEDNWWYDYLHNAEEEVVEQIELFGAPDFIARMDELLGYVPANGINVRYFHQPPGDSVDAENIDNLPGNEEYYTNQKKGKSPAWIEQFVRARWGFSASETPVVKTFRPDIHIARERVIFSPHYELIAGLDPGLGGLACVFGQEDLHGRLLLLGEVIAVGMGAHRFITDKLKPYIRANFPHATIKFAPDPQAAARAQTDEKAVTDVIKKHFGTNSVSIESNNRLAIRLDAIEHYTTRITEMGQALLIDKEKCPQLVRALSGGWRYQKMVKSDSNKPEPEKNSYSHVGDSFGYLCRYFHKQFLKDGKHGRTIAEQRARSYVPQSIPRYHHV